MEYKPLKKHPTVSVGADALVFVNFGTEKQKVKKLWKNKNGYWRFTVHFRVDGKWMNEKFYVHQEVLILHVCDRPLDAAGNPMEASHIDGDQNNNRLSNLLWESKANNLFRRIIHTFLTKIGVPRDRIVAETAWQVDSYGSLEAAAARLKKPKRERKKRARQGVKPAEQRAEPARQGVRLGKTEKAGVVKIPAVACDEETTAPLGASPAGPPAPSPAT